MIRLSFFLMLPVFTLAADRMQPFKDAGTHKNPKGKCEVKISVSDSGGFKVLELPGLQKKVVKVKDMTGALWAGKGRLVYTTSSVYGIPGLYSFDCASRKTRTLVAAKNLDKSYPSGSDYFELNGLSEDGTKIQFFYAPDVDNAAFEKFRTPEFLHQVDLRGEGFEKVK